MGITSVKTMTRTSDQQLLREFAGQGDEQAFDALVKRHLPLVHSIARRQLGDAVLAEDVSQQVFVLLARKARNLSAGVILSGWLYQTTRHVACHVARAELRRRTREQHAVAHMIHEAPDSVWRSIEHDLDVAMESLKELDRVAIVLRYYENRSLREVGQVLGSTDDAAQKRLSRAVAKLREWFHRRGRTLGASSLATAISSFAIAPVPASVTSGIAATALHSASILSSTATTSTLKSFMITPFIKPALVSLVTLSAAAAWLSEHRQLSAQRAQNLALEARIVELESTQPTPAEPNSPMVAKLTEAERLELVQLRGDVRRLRRELAGLKSAPAVQVPSPSSAVAVTENLNPALNVLEPKALQEQVEVLKRVGLGMRILCSQVEADPKLKSIQFTPESPLPKEVLDVLGPVAASLDQVELLVPDVAWMLKAEAMPDSIIARARRALPTQDGQFIREYAMGDGSVQSIRHATSEEAFGWGQRLDGTPVQWDLGQGSLVIDPALARRYGLKIGGQ